MTCSLSVLLIFIHYIFNENLLCARHQDSGNAGLYSKVQEHLSSRSLRSVIRSKVKSAMEKASLVGNTVVSRNSINHTHKMG